jgi:two-component system alkaline phosphatase synthesis response regulator PhoP
MSDRVCLIEDDPTIQEILGAKLRGEGFEVQLSDRAEGLLEGESALADLYIIDVMLAGPASGFELCQRLRRRSAMVPILILSAISEPLKRVEGLRHGADDYLTKPFELEELMLRVHGMLRRRSWYRSLAEDGSAFQWDGNRIDFQRLEGSNPRERFAMSSKECMLMKVLIEREGEIVSRDEILDRVWGYNLFPSTRTVDNFILRLRRYFEPEPKAPKYIHSVRGMGYKFTSGKGN